MNDSALAHGWYKSQLILSTSATSLAFEFDDVGIGDTIIESKLIDNFGEIISVIKEILHQRRHMWLLFSIEARREWCVLVESSTCCSFWTPFGWTCIFAISEFYDVMFLRQMLFNLNQ